MNIIFPVSKSMLNRLDRSICLIKKTFGSRGFNVGKTHSDKALFILMINEVIYKCLNDNIVLYVTVRPSVICTT